MPVGTYTLILERTASDSLAVGALGDVEFASGWYAYVGSAFGPGGFGRVDRHRRVASGENDARHWHVDYLLGDAETRLADVVTTADVDLECEIADLIGGQCVPKFGASDCDCSSHLLYRDSRDELVGAVERAHRQVRD